MQNKSKLCVNLDHIATLRQARCSGYPNLADAINIALESGADGITLHLREDKRHVQTSDIYMARELCHKHNKTFTFEMALTDEMSNLAKIIQPDLITLVPEKRQELTTEGGLSLSQNTNYINNYIQDLFQSNLKVSLFIEPDIQTIQQAKDLYNISCIELHTGEYSNNPISAELDKLEQASQYAHNLNIQVNAGHGLSHDNLPALVQTSTHKYIQEYHIGFAIVARAVFIGLDNAIAEIKSLIY